MEYTKEDLKMWWEPTMYLPWLQPYLIKFADAWAREVAELEMDKEELRDLCRLMVFRENRKSDRFKDLWAKHMKGTAEKTKRKEQE